jgi:hypothetical protein
MVIQGNLHAFRIAVVSGVDRQEWINVISVIITPEITVCRTAMVIGVVPLK